MTKRDPMLALVASAAKLHHQYVQAIGHELDCLGFHDINGDRALILLHLGESEMTATQVLLNDCYIGTNVSYSLCKLAEAGWIIERTPATDRRVKLVRNSPRGLGLCKALETMMAAHAKAAASVGITPDNLADSTHTMRVVQATFDAMRVLVRETERA